MWLAFLFLGLRLIMAHTLSWTFLILIISAITAMGRVGMLIRYVLLCSNLSFTHFVLVPAQHDVSNPLTHPRLTNKNPVYMHAATSSHPSPPSSAPNLHSAEKP